MIFFLWAALYLAWLGLSVPIYIFALCLILAALILLQGLASMLCLTKITWLNRRIWASWQQAPDYQTLGCGMGVLFMAMLILVSVVFTILHVYSPNFSLFMSQGGWPLALVGGAEGVDWIIHLRYLSQERDKMRFLAKFSQFLKIWAGLLLYWLIGGVLALAFGPPYIIALVIIIGFFGITNMTVNLNFLYKKAI
jgi:hypothetical protein